MRRDSITDGLCWSLLLAVSLATQACDNGSQFPPASASGAAPSAQGGSAGSTAGGVAASGGIPQINLGSGGSGGQPPLFNGRVERNSAALPVAGGTLLVTSDGSIAIAADPERAALFLVDLESRAVREIRVEPDDELGRVAEGPAGVAYVLARRGGALLVIDLALGTLRQRVPVCAAPRGVAFDPAINAVHVACRSGRLVTFDANTLARTRLLQLDSDLRDVLVRGSELVLTRFRSAELLVLDAQGKLLRRAIPSPQPGCATATVAYRAVLAQNGEVFVAHQSSSDDAIGISSGGYGFSCGGGLVSASVTVASLDRAPKPAASDVPPDPLDNPTAAVALTSLQVPSATGPLDVAASSNGKIAVLVNGFAPDVAGATGPISLASGTLTTDENGLPALTGQGLTLTRLVGEPVAVAFDPAGDYIVQSRQPAQLIFANGSIVPLSAESRLDTGQQMFHLNTGLGIACASCHPEGDEDGHLWHFSFGLRRTQPLQGGVLSRAPFHWDGDLAAMDDLVSEVMIKRMGLQQRPSLEQTAALASWLDGLKLERDVDELDLAAVSRGAELFQEPSVGCAACHAGPQFTDNLAHDVGTGGPFSTPTLLGVGLRPALFHDGCAPSLDARFGACGGGDQHGSTSQLSAGELQDLLAYLKSL